MTEINLSDPPEIDFGQPKETRNAYFEWLLDNDVIERDQLKEITGNASLRYHSKCLEHLDERGKPAAAMVVQTMIMDTMASAAKRGRADPMFDRLEEELKDDERDHANIGFAVGRAIGRAGEVPADLADGIDYGELPEQLLRFANRTVRP